MRTEQRWRKVEVEETLIVLEEQERQELYDAIDEILSHLRFLAIENPQYVLCLKRFHETLTSTP